MSGGTVCKCPERAKPIGERKWRVLQLRCNHSAFNGYHYTRSDWSSVTCIGCRATWRTKAGYVFSLPEYDDAEQRATPSTREGVTWEVQA